jgi:DNA-binding transcriptional ArsR family regulator
VKTDQNAQLDALGDPTRRAIFDLLTREERAVGELAERFPISRPAVSQHLRVLSEAGLLTVRRDGTRRLYAADPSGIAKLAASVERFWRDALVAFKAAAEPPPALPPDAPPTDAPPSEEKP